MGFEVWTKRGRRFTDWGAFTNGAYKRNEYVVVVIRGLHDMRYEITTKGYPLARVASCYLESA